MRRLLILPLLLLASPVWADEQVEAGQQLFEQYCAGACHQAPVPSRLSAKQWRIVLKTMQRRMQSKGIEPLSEQEMQQVYRYLTQG